MTSPAETGGTATEKSESTEFVTDVVSAASVMQGVASQQLAGHRYLVPVPLANLRSQFISPQTFAVDGLVPDGVVTLLGGHGGSGKSMLALTFAAHVACGKAWHGCRVGLGRAVYLSLEDDRDTIKRRLRHIIEVHQLDENLIDANLELLDGTSCECELVHVTRGMSHAKVMPTASMEELVSSASGSRLVVIDNASEIHEVDENSRAEVSAFVRILSKMARDQRTAVLLLAHVDKAAARNGARGNTYSGSTAWHNSVRSRLALVASGSDGLQLVHEKLNCGMLHGTIHLEWDSHGVLVASDMQPMSSLAMTSEQRRAQEGREEALILHALQEEIRSGRHVSTASSSSKNTFRTLLQNSKIRCEFGAKDGRRRFLVAIRRLENSGEIWREAYQSNDRKLKERWVVRDATGAGAMGEAPVVPVASFPPNPL